MELLIKINPDNVDEKTASSWEQREAVRAVIFDKEGKVGLVHMTKEFYYKLPGGGVEQGENAEEALRRECKEELGVGIKITGEVGFSWDYRKKRGIKQKSSCYFADVVGEKGKTNFTRAETEKGAVAVWVDPKTACELLEQNSEDAAEDGKYMKQRDIIFLKEVLKKYE